MTAVTTDRAATPCYLPAVAAAADRAGRRLRPTPQWTYVERPDAQRPAHGWKLHLSARPAALGETLDRALPVLTAAACDFKTVPSVEALAELNSAQAANPASVGKAVTVYPAQDPDALTELARRLARALSGMTAPVIRSDRRVAGDAPVYYRYGPFGQCWRIDANGEPELIMYGPDGQDFPGLAGLFYSCPPWAGDPFCAPVPAKSAPAEGAAPAAALLGGRYRLERCVQSTARGAVYRAHDTTSGGAVFVKQAYAWVGERPDGSDTRMLLRNGRRILAHLDGAGNTPRLVDHFRHGTDEYLVTPNLGASTLRADVAEHGVYLDPVDTPAPARVDGATLSGLARRLLELLDAVHARGVVVRDLAPKNLILGEGGKLHIIDLDIAACRGLQLPGHTPGYAAPAQRDNPPARSEDDYYSLGATLFHAATGLEPVVDEKDGPARERTLTRLADLYPAVAEGTARGALALIPDLLHEDAAHRARAAERLRTGAEELTGQSTCIADTSMTDRELDRTTERLLRELHHYAQQTTGPQRGTPASTTLFSGTAGIALELLRHPDPASQRAALRLAAHAAHPDRVLASEGWMFGATGTAVALAAVARHIRSGPAPVTGADADAEDVPNADALAAAAARLAPPDPTLLPGPDQATDDCTHGLAGLGLAHLRLADLLGDPRHATVAEHCLTRLAGGDCRTAADGSETDRPGTGASVRHGHAHGTAGLLGFLLAYRGSGREHPASDAACEQWTTALVRQTHEMIAATALPTCRPLVLSWCQGLAGVGHTLLYAGRILHRPDLTDLAAQAGLAAAPFAARTAVVNQCCGMAGFGEFLLDLAHETGEAEFTRQARRIAVLAATRAPAAPTPPDALTTRLASFGYGSAGVLAFLRRARQHPAHIESDDDSALRPTRPW